MKPSTLMMLVAAAICVGVIADGVNLDGCHCDGCGGASEGQYKKDTTLKYVKGDEGDEARLKCSEMCRKDPNCMRTLLTESSCALYNKGAKVLKADSGPYANLEHCWARTDKCTYSFTSTCGLANGDYIYTDVFKKNEHGTYIQTEDQSKAIVGENDGYAQFGINNQKLVNRMMEECWDNGKFDNTRPGCQYAVNDHHQDVERTFVNYATDYTRKMDKVQNGIEGLAQLHSTHDEMWHRICAIAERGAKYRMQEFKDAIQTFKNSMIDFKGKHSAMIEKKAKMEAAKVKMTISLQKWLTARKAHAAAHTRYVNFLHHLGLDFKDKNPAARYWREYSHGVTGGTRSNNKVAGRPGYQKHGTPDGGTTVQGEPNPGGKVFGGWTPLQGPIPHLGQHSHKVFIDKLESIAQTSNRVGIFEDPKNPLHNYVYNATHGGRENSGNPNSSVVPPGPGIYGYAQAGENKFQVELMDKPFYDHMALSTNLLESEPTSMPSVSGLHDRSQQEKHNGPTSAPPCYMKPDSMVGDSVNSMVGQSCEYYTRAVAAKSDKVINGVTGQSCDGRECCQFANPAFTWFYCPTFCGHCDDQNPYEHDFWAGAPGT